MIFVLAWNYFASQVFFPLLFVPWLALPRFFHPVLEIVPACSRPLQMLTLVTAERDVVLKADARRESSILTQDDSPPSTSTSSSSTCDPNFTQYRKEALEFAEKLLPKKRYPVIQDHGIPDPLPIHAKPRTPTNFTFGGILPSEAHALVSVIEQYGVDFVVESGTGFGVSAEMVVTNAYVDRNKNDDLADYIENEDQMEEQQENKKSTENIFKGTTVRTESSPAPSSTFVFHSFELEADCKMDGKINHTTGDPTTLAAGGAGTGPRQSAAPLTTTSASTDGPAAAAANAKTTAKEQSNRKANAGATSTSQNIKYSEDEISAALVFEEDYSRQDAKLTSNTTSTSTPVVAATRSCTTSAHTWNATVARIFRRTSAILHDRDGGRLYQKEFLKLPFSTYLHKTGKGDNLHKATSGAPPASKTSRRNPWFSPSSTSDPSISMCSDDAENKISPRLGADRFQGENLMTLYEEDTVRPYGQNLHKNGLQGFCKDEVSRKLGQIPENIVSGVLGGWGPILVRGVRDVVSRWKQVKPESGEKNKMQKDREGDENTESMPTTTAGRIFWTSSENDDLLRKRGRARSDNKPASQERPNGEDLLQVKKSTEDVLEGGLAAEDKRVVAQDEDVVGDDAELSIHSRYLYDEEDINAEDKTAPDDSVDPAPALLTYTTPRTRNKRKTILRFTANRNSKFFFRSLIGRNPDKRVGVFIDGPKGNEAYQFGRELFDEFDNVVFFALHDTNPNIGSKNFTDTKFYRTKDPPTKTVFPLNKGKKIALSTTTSASSERNYSVDIRPERDDGSSTDGKTERCWMLDPRFGSCNRLSLSTDVWFPTSRAESYDFWWLPSCRRPYVIETFQPYYRSKFAHLDQDSVAELRHRWLDEFDIHPSETWARDMPKDDRWKRLFEIKRGGHGLTLFVRRGAEKVAG
ncbi:unnamed protein product [Amoebophrya sp. A120]|nr:unnamed protein product [Amoebophrya sp. A120]|eukprot:GSA120T00007110001.1